MINLPELERQKQHIKKVEALKMCKQEIGAILKDGIKQASKILKRGD